MATITASEEHGLDIFETSISSLLEPSIASVRSDQAVLTYSGGFSDILDGHGFLLSADGEIIAGTITGVTETRDGATIFRISDMTLPATLVMKWFADGDYDGFFRHVLSGSDVVRGSGTDDRIAVFAGDDVVEGGGGDDFILGDLGNDTLIGGRGDDYILGGEGDDMLAGGPGDDVLDGGEGHDLAAYSGWYRSYSIEGTGDLAVLGDGTDILHDMERIGFRDGVLELAETAAFAEATRLFASVLGRAPDRAGLDFYVDQMEDRGVSLAAVADDLIGSAEFQAATGGLSNAQFVEYIYGHALGRAPDAGGATFYTQALDGGMSRGAFVVELSESAEHRALTAELVARGYFNTDDSYQAVALLYDGAFGRLPDAGGLGFYGEQVKAGAMTLAQVATDFAASAEFRAAVSGKSHGEIVDLIYQNTLDRAPDPGGRAFYTGLLDGGASVAEVFQDIGFSAEHHYLYSAHITNGIDVL